MTSQTHAPGPWKIGDQSHDVLSADGHCVASCGPKRNYSNGMGVSLANARLIAAAPSLLAACEAALKRLDGGDLQFDNRLVGQLHAAIREARG